MVNIGRGRCRAGGEYTADRVGSGPGVFIIGEAGLYRLQHHFQGLQLHTPTNWALAVGGQRQGCVHHPAYRFVDSDNHDTTRAGRNTFVGAAILPTCHILFLGKTMPRGQLDIDVVQWLMTKSDGTCMLRVRLPVAGGTTPNKRKTAGAVSVRRLSVSLAEMKRIAECEEEPGAHGGSFTEDLLVRGAATVIETDQAHILRLKVLENAADQASRKVLPPEKLQQQQELVLGEMLETFYRSLMGDPPAKVAPKHNLNKIRRGASLDADIPARAGVGDRPTAGAAGRAEGQNETYPEGGVEQVHPRGGLGRGAGRFVEGRKGAGGAHDARASAHIQGAAARGVPPAGIRCV